MDTCYARAEELVCVRWARRLQLAAQIGLSRSIGLSRRRSFHWHGDRRFEVPTRGVTAATLSPSFLPAFLSSIHIPPWTSPGPLPLPPYSWPCLLDLDWIADQSELADVLLLSSLTTLLFNSAQITRFCLEEISFLLLNRRVLPLGRSRHCPWTFFGFFFLSFFVIWVIKSYWYNVN